MHNTADKGLFNVAVKLFLRKENTLLILHDVFGDWDLPGGRILPQEFGGDIKGVIHRKIKQELGDKVFYELGDLITCFQVQRVDHGTGQISSIFAVGFVAEYQSGEVQLGSHHDKAHWVDVTTLNPNDYFKHGWETGVSDYLKKAS